MIREPTSSSYLEDPTAKCSTRPGSSIRAHESGRNDIQQSARRLELMRCSFMTTALTLLFSLGDGTKRTRVCTIDYRTPGPSSWRTTRGWRCTRELAQHHARTQPWPMMRPKGLPFFLVDSMACDILAMCGTTCMPITHGSTA